MSTPYERLKRWRDIGDGPAAYTAGDGNFGADVTAILSEIERLRATLKPFADIAQAHERAYSQRRKHYEDEGRTLPPPKDHEYVDATLGQCRAAARALQQSTREDR